MSGSTKPLHGWGRYPIVDGYELTASDLESITQDAVLTRGLGRSYGDASLPPFPGARVANSTRANRILSLDEKSGILRAEAGVSLLQLNDALLTRGWFTPVSPGTQNVTLGGMVAADVHGKNHHVEGCFGEHVTSLRLHVADGRVVTASEQENPDLFRATIGGMGLTGHILELEVRMERIRSPWIISERERVDDLDTHIGRLKEASAEWPFTVGWADCVAPGPRRGRGILIKGRWAEPGEGHAEAPKAQPRFAIPLTLPNWLLNGMSIGAHNSLRFAAGRFAEGRHTEHPRSFFYPLDIVDEWNRLYGSRGFTQYQCVLPYDGTHTRFHRLFDIIARHQPKPYLCVVKDCGPEGKGMLSFPKPGISFALDFPVVGEKTQRVVDAMNDLVAAEGGRVYLAKDAFTRREHFEAMEPRLAAWNAVRDRWDPDHRLGSALSVRLLGDNGRPAG